MEGLRTGTTKAILSRQALQLRSDIPVVVALSHLMFVPHVWVKRAPALPEGLGTSPSPCRTLAHPPVPFAFPWEHWGDPRGTRLPSRGAWPGCCCGAVAVPWGGVWGCCAVLDTSGPPGRVPLDVLSAPSATVGNICCVQGKGPKPTQGHSSPSGPAGEACGGAAAWGPSGFGSGAIPQPVRAMSPFGHGLHSHRMLAGDGDTPGQRLTIWGGFVDLRHQGEALYHSKCRQSSIKLHGHAQGRQAAPQARG